MILLMITLFWVGDDSTVVGWVVIVAGETGRICLSRVDVDGD